MTVEELFAAYEDSLEPAKQAKVALQQSDEVLAAANLDQSDKKAASVNADIAVDTAIDALIAGLQAERRTGATVSGPVSLRSLTLRTK